MAESNDPITPNSEEPKTKKPESTAAPADSPEVETAATTAGEKAPVVVSADAGGKSAAPEARPAVKTAKKTAQSKKEEAAAPVAAPENPLLLADDIWKTKGRQTQSH